MTETKDVVIENGIPEPGTLVTGSVGLPSGEFPRFALKVQDKKSKRGNKPDGLEGIRNQMESVESGKQG
jgi:hypothetical protein